MKGFLRILVGALACLVFIHKLSSKTLPEVAQWKIQLTIRPDVPTPSCTRDPPSPERSLLWGGWSSPTEPQLLQMGQLSKPQGFAACYIRGEMTLAKSTFPVAPVRSNPQDLCACHYLTQGLGAGVHPELGTLDTGKGKMQSPGGSRTTWPPEGTTCIPTAPGTALGQGGSCRWGFPRQPEFTLLGVKSKVYLYVKSIISLLHTVREKGLATRITNTVWNVQ